ncbi:GntR family transcriptional regulator [Acrocarpospora macrocephala]
MLDRSGSTPLYQQVERKIRERISAGELPAGSPVPSEKTLMRDFGISRDTARRVLKELRKDGTVYNEKGLGTFVGPPSVPRQVQTDSRYREIAADLANEIRIGTYQPTRPIPSEAHLTQRYEVTTKTVRKAVGVLRDQGWVYTKSRKGTYVSDPDSWPQEPDESEES